MVFTIAEKALVDLLLGFVILVICLFVIVKTDCCPPRSSLRRTMSNTHLINGFYAAPDSARIAQYYAHGPYYECPDRSPYVADGPRIYKSDRHSFFNGKVFTVRDVPK